MEIWAELQRIGTLVSFLCYRFFGKLGSVLFLFVFYNYDEKRTLQKSFVGYCKSVHFMPRFRLSHTLGIFTLIRTMQLDMPV